jgi:hypothetical protein
MISKNRSPSLLVALSILLLSVAVPAQAQRSFEPLFDKFNVKLEGSWIALNTEIGLDSETLGTGTTLNFEDDLGLSSGETVPSLAFEWQIARKHRLAVRWQDISRDSSAQALTQIQWGDEVIPVDAAITLAFDLTQYYVDYSYYPWVTDRWAAGFGLGLRWLDLYTELRWEEQTIGEGGDKVDASAPLPYLYFEYRRLLSDRWRLIAGVGWLSLTIDDISGGQYIGRASIEYLAGRRWAFGASFNLSNVNADVENLEDDEGNPEFTARVDMDLNDFSVFVRLRF